MNDQLRDERDAVAWLFKEVRAGRRLPVQEAQAAIHCLYVALHGNGHATLAPEKTSDPDVHHATHAINVALTAMTAALAMGATPRDVREIGLAGLLHDIGMVRIPSELLEKNEQLTPDERALIMRHPADGAAIILESESALDVPAVAAYEHHLRPDGTGYPALTYPRRGHRISRLIAVCATYHALTSPRPFRGAWLSQDALTIIAAAADRDLDREMVTVVTTQLRAGAA